MILATVVAAEPRRRDRRRRWQPNGGGVTGDGGGGRQAAGSAPVIGICAVRQRARRAFLNQEAHLVADSYVPHPEAEDRSRLFGALVEAAQRTSNPVSPSGSSLRTSTLSTSA